MAYGTKYQAAFKNRQQQVVALNILLKDYVGDAEEVTVKSLDLTDSSDENTIIARECTFALRADDGTTITWETFLAGSYDEWKISATVDGQPHFDGFLTPEEGNSPFLDKPYNIKSRATNGIKLLKDVALTNLSGDNFHGRFTLLEYLTACLQKTILDLPIRIYGSVYNIAMDDRADDVAATYWNQTKLDHRTFLKDPTLFVNCYDALLILLGRHSKLFYWNGMWTIFYNPEHQYAPGGIFYTDFDSSGVLISGAEDTEGYATVGKGQQLYPVTADQDLSSSFPIKYSKTIFNYKIWPEIPLNNKFQRGTLLGSGTDGDGNPYEDYSIDDWEANMVDITVTPPNFTFNPVEGSIFVRRTSNIYGIELKREIFFDTPTTASPGGSYVKWLRAEPLPVNQGDKIKISAQLRFDNDFSGSGDSFSIIGRVYLIPDTGTVYYSLDNNVGGLETGFGKWILESGTPPNFISVDIPLDSDSTKFKSITIEADTIPANGTLFMALQHSNDGTNAGGNKWFTGFQFEYIPYVAGGYIPVSGDYWQHLQNANQLDKDEAEIKISDSRIRVLQGCLFYEGGIAATNPTWYRYGVTETKEFKELADIGRYNLGYRRFWRIEGTFKRLQFSPVNDPLNFQPIGYHKNYRFTDLPSPRDFIITTPLAMDLVSCKTKITFEEVYKDSNDGTQIGDQQNKGFIFSNS